MPKPPHVRRILQRALGFIRGPFSSGRVAAVVWTLVSLIVLLAGINAVRLWQAFYSPGVIVLSAPQIYTRERMVNDRIRESAWLDGQLEAADEPAAFAAPRAATESFVEGRVRATANATTEDTGHGQRSDTGATAQELTRIQRFIATREYRQEVRTALLREQLDDRHDIDGNTLYRMDFAASLDFGASSWRTGVIVAKLSEDVQPERQSENYLQIYEEWRADLNDQMDRAKQDLEGSIRNGDLGADSSEFNRFVLEMACHWRKNGRVPYGPNLQDRLELQKQPEPPCEPDQADVDTVYSFLRTIEQIWRANEIHRIAREVPDDLKLHPSASDAPTMSDAPGSRGAAADASATGPLGSCAQKETVRDLARCVEEGCAATSRALCPRSLGHQLGQLMFLNWITHPQVCLENVTPSCLVDEDVSEGPDALRCRLDPFQSDCSWRSWKQGTGEFFGLVDRRLQDLGRQSAARWLGVYLYFKYANKHLTSAWPFDLRTIFDLGLVDCSVGACRPFVAVKRSHNGDVDPEAIRKLREELSRGAQSFTYDVTSDGRGEYVGRRAQRRLLGDLPAAGAALEIDAGSETRETIRDTTVIGIGDWGRSARHLPRPQDFDVHAEVATTFAWLIPPSGLGVTRTPGTLTLNVLTSLPSWWKTARLEVTTCWRGTAVDHVRQEAVDLISSTEAVDIRALCGARREWSDLLLTLPGSADDVSQKLRVEVIKDPYLLGDEPASPLVAEIGRSVTLVLAGGRLWKSPVVTLAHQRADRLTILPNMKGIVAEFDCVLEPPGFGLEGAVPLSVWTSEDRTKSQEVTLLRFKGKRNETPCYLRSDAGDQLQVQALGR